ncbi:dienelactone hydrolase [Nocardia fluminea]|uniref:Dienelactone hydrolase n=2 Tax=Nocardia fluminea TaxID=134984 RepID=A0A2N3WXK3_9NOCA|nr:dienelactone hydrolase [Nocardia fluminea]
MSGASPGRRIAASTTRSRSRRSWVCEVRAAAYHSVGLTDTVFCLRQNSKLAGSEITTVDLMATVTTRTVQYLADGLTMAGHLTLPAGDERRPAVLLGPEGPGLSDVERRRAEALAELGYVTLAFDLHGGQYLADPEAMLARCMPLLDDPGRMRDIGYAALDVLRAEPRTDPGRIAAIGYGTGGAIALELGRAGVDLRAIATVNGLITGRPGEAARIRCPVWAGVGSEDPIMSAAKREAFATEMQSAGLDWRLVVYGGALHAFHHPPVDQPVVPGVGYHARHAQRAWRDVVELLDENLNDKAKIIVGS